MLERTIQIRDDDWKVILVMAEREWRAAHPEQQLSALIERAVQAERRSSTDGKPRSRRRAPALNGALAAAHS